MSSATDPATLALTGALPFLLIAAAVLALPVSLLLLALYRRAVLHSMRSSLGTVGTGDLTIAAISPARGLNAAVPAPVERSHAPATPTDPDTAAQTLLARSLKAPWRLAAVYAAAGLAYALAFAAFWFAATGIEVSPFRFPIVAAIHAWPIVIAVGLVAATSPRERLAVLGSYLLILALLISVATGELAVWLSMVGNWAITNGLPTLLLLLFLHRRIRAVGPLVFAFLFLAVLGAAAILFVVGSSDQRLGLAAAVGSVLGLGASETLLVLGLLGLALFGVLGWLTVRWIRGRYERKQVSDQSILLDAIWLVFAASHSMYLAFMGPAWTLAGPVCFVLYKGVTRIGISLMGGARKRGVRDPTLLLLRVFSLGRRSERLFDAVGLHWRHVGSIRLIAGPDLATTTIEPHEFLDFATGKLARRFIHDPQSLEPRVAEMDLVADHDGRFRVNEFFCTEDTWRHTLARLLRDSDVVLMDLRGFSDQNAGCRHEIEALIDMAPLSRVVFITDETTDAGFLEVVVQEAWKGMRPDSPNQGSSPEQLRRHHISREERGAERQLLGALCAGAQRGQVPVLVS